MRVLTRHGDFIPTHALNAGDDADRLAFLFQDRPLLDMQFEQAGETALSDGFGAAIADYFERLTKADAVAISLLRIWTGRFPL